ncbi:glycosyltransferase family 2 protein [Spirillospora sp. CA-294931]|uniref:glycosyltransferase family 2 protein n=1 Tax=Spirillospora sp. CA-294931 TaxID=3240042 RepID=UPI003D8BDE9B
MTLTAIVPAHNEEHGLPATLASLQAQTVPPDEIIVVDDASTDRTGEVARAHNVTVLRPPRNLGSKAKAQNYALPHITTDLVLAVDADTVLAPDYIARLKPAFDDPEVAIASGNVQTRFTRTPWDADAPSSTSSASTGTARSRPGPRAPWSARAAARCSAATS